jgi:hypothetical protein
MSWTEADAWLAIVALATVVFVLKREDRRSFRAWERQRREYERARPTWITTTREPEREEPKPPSRKGDA